MWRIAQPHRVLSPELSAQGASTLPSSNHHADIFFTADHVQLVAYQHLRQAPILILCGAGDLDDVANLHFSLSEGLAVPGLGAIAVVAFWKTPGSDCNDGSGAA